MKQKQYHSLEELPLMMNMTDVAAVLGISRAGATNSPMTAVPRISDRQTDCRFTREIPRLAGSAV